MVTKHSYEEKDIQQIITELGKPEVHASLLSLVKKLPEFEKNLTSIDNAVQFGKAVFEDKAAIEKYDKLVSTYNINFETISSIIVLLEKLPKLVALLEQFESLIDFAAAVVQDRQTTEAIMSSAKDYVKPLIEKGEEGAAFIEEVKMKAHQDNQPITLLSLMKWIKEPAVQQSLRYAKAALDVVSEKSMGE